MRFISDDVRSSTAWPVRNTFVVGSLALVTSLAMGIGAAGGLSVLDEPDRNRWHAVPPLPAGPLPQVVVPQQPSAASPSPGQPREREAHRDVAAAAPDVRNTRDVESKPEPPAEPPVEETVHETEETVHETESSVSRQAQRVVERAWLEYESIMSRHREAPGCPGESVEAWVPDASSWIVVHRYEH